MKKRRESNRQLVTEFFTLAFLERDHITAAEKYLSHRYVQHSANAADGIDGFMVACDRSTRQSSTVRILRVVADLDYVAVHSLVSEDTGGGHIRVDIYRIEEGRIAEHWETSKELTDPSTIPHTNGEIETLATDTSSDAETNRRNAVLFYDLGFVQKRYVEAADAFIGDRYIQHNSFIEDGIEAYKRHFGDSSEHRRSSYCQMPLRFIVDDDHAVVQVLLRKDLNQRDEKGIVINDIFRFDQGQIVEHWDVGIEIPDPHTMPHSNGVL